MSRTVATVAAGFRELLTRVELNATRINLASQRYDGVRQQVESALPGSRVFQIGSFQRRTKIRPIKDSDPLDIDVGVCLGDFHRYVSDGSGIYPSQALEAAKRSLTLDGTYEAMKPESDAPTVVLEYADGFKIELVPCYRDLTGTYPRQAGPACYVVGNAAGSWVPADYDYDAAYISGANQLQAVSQALVPAIKMVKRFLRNHNIELKSFHTEILCALILPQSIAGWNRQNLHWGYQHVLAQILSQAPNHLNGAVAIPDSYSRSVDSGLSVYRLQQIGQYLAKCGNCAWGICKVQDEGQALDLWRQFYGEPFPAKGD